jgi:hypothetical protein
MTAEPAAEIKPLVPKQGGRIATLETDVAKLRTEVNNLKKVVARLMMSNPDVQAGIQKMLIDQIDQQGTAESS